MALEFAHGAISWTTGEGAGTDKAVSGLGFQPKALRFYWMGISSATDAASQTTHERRGIGFASDVTGSIVQRCIGTTSMDNDASSAANCGSMARNDSVVVTVNASGSQDGRLSLQSFDSDGFTLNVDDVAVANITIFWEAWGGDDITDVTISDFAEPSATGTQNYTATGFEASPANPDQVVMFAGCQCTAALNTGAATDSGLMVAFSTGTASAENIVIVGNSDDASGTMDTDGVAANTACISMVVVGGGSTTSALAVLSALNTDQFTLNWTARLTTNRRYIYMAIKGGSWAAGEYTINGNTANATATVSGLSFAPKGVLLMGRGAAEGASTTNDIVCLGTGTSTSSRRSMGVRDENGTASAEIDIAIEYDQILVIPSASGTVLSAYDLNAMNSDGFQIIVDTAGGVASEWQGYLAFGDAPAAGTTVSVPMRSHTYTGQTPQVRARVQPAAIAHTYTMQTPSATVATNVLPDPVTHTYTVFAPQARASVAPAAVEHDYVAQQPRFVQTMHAPEISHSYLAIPPEARASVAPSPATHAYTAIAPQARASVASSPVAHAYTAIAPQARARVQPGSTSHTYSPLVPQTQAGASVQPAAVAHSYTAQQPQVRASVDAASVIHVYTGLSPNISAGGSVSVGSTTHSYNALAPQANASVMPGPAVHTYSGAVPSTAVSTTVRAPVAVHTYTAVVPDVQAPPSVISKPPFGRQFPRGYSPVEFKPNKREWPLEPGVEVVEPVIEPVHYEVPGRLLAAAEMSAEHVLDAYADAAIVAPEASSSGLGYMDAVELPQPVAIAIELDVQKVVLRDTIVVTSLIEVQLASDSELFAWERRPVSEQDALDILSKLLNR